MASSLFGLKRSLNSSVLFKTLTTPITSISRLLNAANPITSTHLRFFQSGSLGKSCNMTEKRNIADHKRRLLVYKYEVKRKLYKAMCRDPDLPTEMLEACRQKLSRLPRNSSATRVRTRCVVTGRPRAVFQKFQISRIVFRELARKGELDGVKKASW